MIPFCENELMDNDSLVSIYKEVFFKSKLVNWKSLKIDEVMGLFPSHVFSILK